MSVTVNGVQVNTDNWPSKELAAVHELLRQQAVELELLADHADDDTNAAAIEKLLEQEVDVPDPTPEECRRFYDARLERYRSGDLVHARHILFQVTQNTPIGDLARLASAMLMELRTDPELFEKRARENSNCPSGEHGGNLGQLQRGETVPEFEKALFDTEDTGILPNLVKTRYGFHIVSVDERLPGKQLPFDIIRDRVAADLKRNTEQRALSQYTRVLAGDADIQGVELDPTGSPLVQ